MEPDNTCEQTFTAVFRIKNNNNQTFVEQLTPKDFEFNIHSCFNKLLKQYLAEFAL